MCARIHRFKRGAEPFLGAEQPPMMTGYFHPTSKPDIYKMEFDEGIVTGVVIQ